MTGCAWSWCTALSGVVRGSNLEIKPNHVSSSWSKWNEPFFTVYSIIYDSFYACCYVLPHLGFHSIFLADFVCVCVYVFVCAFICRAAWVLWIWMTGDLSIPRASLSADFPVEPWPRFHTRCFFFSFFLLCTIFLLSLYNAGQFLWSFSPHCILQEKMRN